MLEAVARAEASLGVALPALRTSAAGTVERIDEAKRAIEAFLIEELGPDAGRDSEPLIAAFGSMARGEMAPGSDFDFLVILSSLEVDPAHILRYRRAALRGLEAIAAEPPGASGLFGVAISATDLVNTIGLDADSNLHLSRRILLLEESHPLNNPRVHSTLVRAIAARYIHETGSDVPRFLLNDVARYWRTIAVDYQAKRWAELEGRKWGLRYVKLMSTRKVTYASTLVALMWPALSGRPLDPDLLAEQFCSTPVARLAQLSDLGSSDVDALVGQILVVHDWFVGKLADDDFRSAVEGVVHPRESAPGTDMAIAIGHGETLDDLLVELFMATEPLSALSRRYLLF